MTIKVFPSRLTHLLLAAVLVVCSSGCATLESNPDKDPSFAIPPPETGTLAEVSRRVMKGRDAETSAFMLLPENDQALRWRLAMIDSASESIDIQTFIWADDEAGHLIAYHLFKAVDRGVRIRILIDDMMKGWSDKALFVASLRENAQVRRFNPGHIRSGVLTPLLEKGLRFETLNRRMHNKQMIFDNRWAIVGGRNIDNHYYGLHEGYNFRDLDLLVTGSIVPVLADDFDEYWNAPDAYPGEKLRKELSEKAIEKNKADFNDRVSRNQELFERAGLPFEPQTWSDELATLPGAMVYGRAVNFQDPPVVKGKRKQQQEDRLAGRLGEVTINEAKETYLVSPYLIPGEGLMEGIQKLTEAGNRVCILTASLASNNHTSAHSHYKKYRKKLLKAGAELWEFKHEPGPDIRAITDSGDVKADFISLHIKAFTQDRRRVYMGSLNLDPRSLDINTENVMVIESPELAQQLVEKFEFMTRPDNAWKVELTEKGKLAWSDGDRELRRQPARGFGQRVMDFLLRLVPIEGQL